MPNTNTLKIAAATIFAALFLMVGLQVPAQADDTTPPDQTWDCASQVAWYQDNANQWAAAYDRVAAQNGSRYNLLQDYVDALRDANRSIQRLELAVVQRDRRIERMSIRIEHLKARLHARR